MSLRFLFDMMNLYCGSKTLMLDRPAIMGVVNLTPDSFSGDGAAGNVQAALSYALAQRDAGADILDLGAESSRPGAASVSLQEELARLIPVLRGLRDCGVPISVDSCKPEVMRIALAEGVSIINDIRALQEPGAMDVVSGSDCAICLMHMQGRPREMQQAPSYGDVATEVGDFLKQRLDALSANGVIAQRCWIDPGFGFGKSFEHNRRLFRNLSSLTGLGYPVLVGVSRKSMLGEITGRDASGRVHASVVAAVLAAQQGASILRVHDVGPTLDALKTWQSLV